MNNLRRRGQSLCDRQDVEESRKLQVQQTVRDTEEEWRSVLHAAKQTEADAQAQISEEYERIQMEVREVCVFDSFYASWLVAGLLLIESNGSFSTFYSQENKIMGSDFWLFSLINLLICFICLFIIILSRKCEIVKNAC